MEVIDDDNVKSSFDAHMNTKWLDFLEEVQSCFKRPQVQLGFRFDKGALSYLVSKGDWDKAMCALRDKIRAARTRPVSMEVRGLVSGS